jgi:hypothetical protein
LTQTLEKILRTVVFRFEKITCKIDKTRLCTANASKHSLQRTPKQKILTIPSQFFCCVANQMPINTRTGGLRYAKKPLLQPQFRVRNTQMRRVTGIKIVPALLALGLLIQPLAATQAEQSGASQITDVELKSDNSFQGKPVDARGQVQPNTPVTIQNVQTGQVVRTTTAADGTFGVQNLQPGVYDVTVGRMTSTVRIWPFQAAPAGSVQQVAYQPHPEGGLPVANDLGGGFVGGNQGGGGLFSGGGGGGFGGNGLLVGGAIIGVTAGIIIAVTAS